MASASAQLLSELDTIGGWPAERRAETLRQITALFLNQANSLASDQIALFDEVFMRLIDGVEPRSLAQFSQQLSDATCVVPVSARRLALHDDELVSIPILKLLRLAPELLLDVAKSRGLKYYLAIAQRHSVDPFVCEALVQCGDTAIHHALAENRGVSISDTGWVRLAQIGETDQELAKKLGRRSDLPMHVKNKLHAKLGTERMRELNIMPQTMRDQIENAVATADAAKVSPELVAAFASMSDLARKGKLNDSTINRFAVHGDYTNVVAAVAFLTGSTVEVILPLISSVNVEGLVVACKASRLDWATVVQIAKNRPGQPPISAAELEKAKATFDAISISAAQRTVRF